MAMLVRHSMSEHPVACGPYDSLSDAVRIMWEQDCGVVPVVDRDGVVVGIVTDRDACIAAYTQDRRLHELTVTLAMSHEVVVCHPEEAITQAVERMRRHQIRRLPVVDNRGRLVGILSLSDLALGGAATQEIAEVLRTVCAPRIVAAA
jgi:CBS domain-containing protein